MENVINYEVEFGSRRSYPRRCPECAAVWVELRPVHVFLYGNLPATPSGVRAVLDKPGAESLVLGTSLTTGGRFRSRKVRVLIKDGYRLTALRCNACGKDILDTWPDIKCREVYSSMAYTPQGEKHLRLGVTDLAFLQTVVRLGTTDWWTASEIMETCNRAGVRATHWSGVGSRLRRLAKRGFLTAERRKYDGDKAKARQAYQTYWFYRAAPLCDLLMERGVL